MRLTATTAALILAFVASQSAYAAPTGLHERSVASDLVNEGGKQLGAAIGADIGNEVKKHLRRSVASDLVNEGGKQLGGAIGADIGNEVKKHLRRSVASDLINEGGKQLGGAIGADIGDEIKKHARSVASEDSHPASTIGAQLPGIITKTPSSGADIIKTNQRSVPVDEEDDEELDGPSGDGNAHTERSLASEAGVTVGSAIGGAVGDEIKKHVHLRSLGSKAGVQVGTAIGGAIGDAVKDHFDNKNSRGLETTIENDLGGGLIGDAVRAADGTAKKSSRSLGSKAGVQVGSGIGSAIGDAVKNHFDNKNSRGLESTIENDLGGGLIGDAVRAADGTAKKGN